MTYITKYTLNKLLKSFDGGEKISIKKFTQEIFTDSRLFFFFNKFELNYLYNYKKFLEDEVKLVAYFKQIPPAQDTQTYVNEYKHSLTYHLDDDCPNLVKDFLGFKIPQEVKDAYLVNELRLWFKENNFISRYMDGLITSNKIIYIYNTSFAIKHRLQILNENYRLIDEKQFSGCSVIEDSFDVFKMQTKLDNIVSKIYRLISTEELERLSKFDWLRNKSDEEIDAKLQHTFGNNIFNKYHRSELISFWNTFHKLKINIMDQLLAYFKWNYKSDKKDLDVVTLENFGLKLCSTCNQKRYLQSITMNNEEME
jgi:hypothetical protein